MTLWDWALHAYAKPGVAEACLALQDDHGQCVPYLLWAAWATAEGRPLNGTILERGAAMARTWENAAVLPLRTARRRMKTPVAGMDDNAREAVRGQVQAAELAAEKALMLALEALIPQGHGSAAMSALLTDAARAWGAAAPPQAIHALAENLSG